MYLFLYSYIIFLPLILTRLGGYSRNRKFFIYSVTFILLFCSVFRNLAVGVDTYAYYESFLASKDRAYSEILFNIGNSFTSNSSIIKDPGFQLFEKILNQLFFGNFELYLAFIALLVLIPIGYFILKYVDNLSSYVIAYAYYICFFYHFLPNSAVRQSIAVGVYFLSSIIWIRNKSLVVPIFLLFIGSFIHKSLLICIIPFLLIRINNKSFFAIATIILSAVLFFFGSQAVLLMGGLIESDAYMHYATAGYYDNNSRPMGFIMQIYIYFLFSLLGKTPLNSMSREHQWFYINFYLAVIFAPLILVDPSLIRVSAYFSIWGIVALPLIINNFSFMPNYRLIVYWIIFALILVRPILQPDTNFRFSWQEMKLHERYH